MYLIVSKQNGLVAATFGTKAEAKRFLVGRSNFEMIEGEIEEGLPRKKAEVENETEDEQEEEEVVEEKSTVDYNEFTVPELKEMAKERGLDVSGLKADYVDALAEDDKE